MATTAVNALQAAHNAGLSCEVIAVDDGSTDNSWLHVKGLDPQIKLIRLPQNQGKGAALRTGFGSSTGKYVSMIDADGDIDADTAIRYALVAEKENLDIVYADKTHPLSQSASSKKRKIISAGYRTVVATLFTIDAKDTQTGCKTFSRSFIKHAIRKTTETGFALDLELFVIAAKGAWKIKNEAVTLNERVNLVL